MQDGQFHIDDPPKKRKIPKPEEVLGVQKTLPSPDEILGEKKNGITPSTNGSEAGGPFSLQSMSGIAARTNPIDPAVEINKQRPVTKNPYASVLDILNQVNYPQEVKKDIYTETLNGNLYPLVDAVNKEREAQEKKKKENQGQRIKSASLEGLGDPTSLGSTGPLVIDSRNEPDPDDERIKVMQTSAASAIDQVMAERFLEKRGLDILSSAKEYGEERRKLRSAIGMEAGFMDESGELDYVKNGLKDRVLHGTMKTVQASAGKLQQEYDYKNEAGMYRSAMEVLDKELGQLITNPSVQSYIEAKTDVNSKAGRGISEEVYNELVEKETLLSQDPSVIEFNGKAKKFNLFYDRLQNLSKSYPAVHWQVNRQKIAEAWSDNIRTNPDFSPKGLRKANLNIFIGEKPDTEKEYQEISDATGIPKDEVKDIIETEGVAGNIGIPSYIGQAWRGATDIVGSAIQGINRMAMDKEQANLINKQIEGTKLNLIKDEEWTIRRIGQTMASGAGMFLGFVATGGAVSAPVKAVGALAKGANLVNAINKASNIGATYITGHLSSLESAYQYAATQTDNEADRQKYAHAVGAANGVSELLLRDIDVAEKILKGKSAVGILENISALKTPFSSTNIFLARMGQVAKVMGYESAEELAPFTTEALLKDNIFGYKMSTAEVFNGALETIVETAISTLPMAGFSSMSVPTKRLMEAALLEAAKTPAQFINKWEDKFKSGEISEAEKNKNIQMVNTVQDIYSKLPKDIAGKPLSEPQKASLINLILGKRQLENDKTKTDPAFHKKTDELISELDKKIDEVIDGKVDWKEQVAAVDDRGDLNEDEKEAEKEKIMLAHGEQVKSEVSSAVIEINGKTYEGKNHAEAILKAQADGQDISQVDRQAEGKFKLSDGTIIDRAEAKQRFGQDRSELLIEQDAAADQANKEYKKTKELTPDEAAVAFRQPEVVQKIIEDSKLLTISQRRLARDIPDVVNPSKQKMSAQNLKDRAEKLQELIVNCLT